jgi:hypothetical protein
VKISPNHCTLTHIQTSGAPRNLLLCITKQAVSSLPAYTTCHFVSKEYQQGTNITFLFSKVVILKVLTNEKRGVG